MFAYKKPDMLVPAKIWMKPEDYYSDAPMIQELEHLAKLPFAAHHVVLSPDGHATGFGMPIGGVIATKGVVLPTAVGLDIGCGMAAVKTSLLTMNKIDLKHLQSLIIEHVPTGFSHRTTAMYNEMPLVRDLSIPDWRVDNKKYFKDTPFYPVLKEEWEKALYQLGTLGGGNHFIELQQGNDGYIWLMLHSGSRNLGKKICEYHQKVAKELNKQWHSEVPPDWQLPFLTTDSIEGKAYLHEMAYALDFAQANRALMVKIIKDLMVQVTGCKFLYDVNIHHNYAAMEHHFGADVLVHRKGATRAREGELGIIPGSQGTNSYIVKGKGNPESFMSCSHGAGRKMSRGKAKAELDLNETIAALDSKGIIHTVKGVGDLDEAPAAYKDIHEVMSCQTDLVDVMVELTPLMVVKGSSEK